MTSPGRENQGYNPNLSTSLFPREELLMKRAGYEGVQRMDVRPTTPSDRFRVDADYDWLLEEKRRVMQQFPSYTYQSTQEAIPGARELLAEALPILAQTYPRRFSYDGSAFVDLQSGAVVTMSSDDPTPLKTLAGVVEEDLVQLHKGSSGRYTLTAGCVCFPSHWSLTNKMGMSVQQIHDPVPGLNRNIGDKIDMLLEILTPERPVSRVNLLVNFNPTLSQIPEVESLVTYPKPQITEESVGKVLWTYFLP